MKTQMPVLFIGHGSPMNAISTNSYSRFLNHLGQKLPRPKSILVISAHWVTRGSLVEKLPRPKTIHDFYGFPEALFKVQYPAPGDPILAEQIVQLATHQGVQTDTDWGLDHGTWSVLRHLYPQADIPVLQLSLNANYTMAQHLALAKELRVLREQGVLILGSGNIVHNLRRVDFRDDAAPMPWAVEFDTMIEKALIEKDLARLQMQIPSEQTLWKEAHPTLEHYLPLIYAVGASLEADPLTFPFHEIQNGSISMRSVQFGA